MHAQHNKSKLNLLKQGGGTRVEIYSMSQVYSFLIRVLMFTKFLSSFTGWKKNIYWLNSHKQN